MSSLGFLLPEHVLLDATSSSRCALLSEILQQLPDLDADVALEVLMARERLGSTGIGHGVAIPHGRMPDLEEPVIAFARHKAGIDFDAIDGQPVHLIVLLFAPDKAEKSHLTLLAGVACLLQQASVRERLMKMDSAEEIAALFADIG